MGDGLVSPLWSEMPREQNCPLSAFPFCWCSETLYQTSHIPPLHYYRPTGLAHPEAQEAVHYGTKPVEHFVSLFGERRQIPITSISRNLANISKNTNLQEYFPKNPVRLFPEYRAEYYSDSVMASFDVYGFFVSVMDGHDFSAFSYSFRCGLACKLRCFLLSLHEVVKCSLERRCHGISFQQRCSSNQIFSPFYNIDSVSRACISMV